MAAILLAVNAGTTYSSVKSTAVTPAKLSMRKPAVGFDHGVGHSLLVLCDAKAPHGKKWNAFKALENYLFIVSISLS